MKEISETRTRQKPFTRKQWLIAFTTIALAFVLGGALVILPQTFAARASNPPHILIVPQSVSYSQQKNIRVGGSYFGRGERVDVYFDYVGPGNLGTFETFEISSNMGQFLAHFHVPLVSTGSHTIAAIGKTSGDIATGTIQILPQMYMSPRAAGPGTLANFYGNSFAASELVNIYWNYIGPGNTGTLLTTATGNATGSFQVSATIPTTKTGQVPVVAIGQTSGTSASTTFILYKQTLALAPLSGSPGTQLTVSAVGYAAFEKVNFYWNNSTTPFASPATNPNGYIQPFIFTVPAGTAPGNYAVKGVGTKSLISIPNTFTVVAPSSNLSSASGPVGSSVTVTASGYAPGETVNVQWNYSGPGTGTTVATATAGFGGTVTTSFTVPTATTGSYPVAVVGTTSSSVTNSSFTIANSLAVGPTTTPPGTNVTATGTGYQAGETVQLFLDSTSGTQLASTIADTNGNINTPIALPTSTTPGAHSVIGVGQTSALLFSTPLTINTNWGDFGFDTTHSRYNPYENSLSISNVAGLTMKWSPFTAPGLRSSPVFANGIVYIGTHDGLLIAFNATTGAQLWKKNFILTFEVPSAPLVDPVNNLVFFGTMGFEDSGIPSPFYALNATTGQLEWSIIMPWNNFGFPSLHFNTVFIGASHEGGNAMLNAIDEMSGHINWQYPTNGGVWGSVAADTVNGVNTIFTGVGNPDNIVLSLNATTGAFIWSYPVPLSPADDDMGSGISVSNGLVLASSKNGNFYALNESDGTFAWLASIGTTDIGNVSSPAVGPDGTIYVGSFDKHLYALDPSGNILWATPTNGLIDGSPALANGVVYFASNDGSIYAVNANPVPANGGGTILWSYATGKLSHSSPVVVNGWLYATSSNGKVYGFSL